MSHLFVLCFFLRVVMGMLVVSILVKCELLLGVLLHTSLLLLNNSLKVLKSPPTDSVEKLKH